MKIIILTAALALTGCATGQAEYYAERTAAHAAESERWKAMARIAESGDTTVKSVAMVTMGAASGSQQVTAAPRSAVDQLLQAVGIFVPAIVQGYGIRANSQLGMRQSDNAAAVAQSTNSAFSSIAGRIQAPAANISTTTSTTSTSSDTHAISDSYSPPTATTTTTTTLPPVATP